MFLNYTNSFAKSNNIKHIMKKFPFLILLVSLAFACSSDDDNSSDTTVTKQQVIDNYANIVYQSYLDSYNAAVTMKTAIDNFVDNPTEAGFTTAKDAWLAAREPYGQTEAYRGNNGPVETEQSNANPWGIGNEGLMNAWPVEEALMDYVTDGAGAGSFDFGSIVGNTSIAITEASVLSYVEYQDNEAAVSTGWHAVEFLLWGQDNTMPSARIAGQRQWTDYTTATNADRRGEYLKVVTSMLVDDINKLVVTWNTGGTYRTYFDTLTEDEALYEAVRGPFFLASDELSGERMLVAVDSDGGIGGLGQEDEHSCFSDNTHRDIYANARGSYNVIFGSYSNAINGPSFYDLVKQINPTQAEALKTSADEAMAKVNVIANNNDPFDYLITQESVTDGQNGPVIEAARALEDWGDEISASATLLGINVQQ